MLTVSSGQVVSGGSLPGGFDTTVVQSGGSVVAATIAPFGVLETQSGGSATNTTVAHDASDDVEGGIDTGAIVQSGGFMFVRSGSALSPLLQPGGSLEVYSGGSVIDPVLQSGSFLTISSGGQVSGASVQPGASIFLPRFPFVSNASASLDPASDVLTITQGGNIETLQLQGDYSGDSFVINDFVEIVGHPTQVESVGVVVLEEHGNILVPAGQDGPVAIGTSTPVQTALAQRIVDAAGQTPGSQTVYNPSASGVPQVTTLSSPVFIDLPELPDTISGSSAVPVAQVLLANPGATYVTGGTGVSTVVAADGTPVTIINDGASDALLAATGAAGNTLEGLAGGNEFITGSGGTDAVLLDASMNTLVSYGVDAVLAGGVSTITAEATGLDDVVMTSGTTLAFIDQSNAPSANSVTGAAFGTIVTAGPGSAVINAGAGPEAFFMDTSAGNVTLNGGAGGRDAFTFVKDAPIGSAIVQISNFTNGDTLAIQGYAGFTVQAAPGGGALLALSDGSLVSFTDVSVAALRQAVRMI